MTDLPRLRAEEVAEIRKRIQALGAAISRRDWHAVEQAYAAIRDSLTTGGAGDVADARRGALETCSRCGKRAPQDDCAGHETEELGMISCPLLPAPPEDKT